MAPSVARLLPLAVLLLVGTARAGDDVLRWALPERGVAIYERDQESVWIPHDERYARRPPWSRPLNPAVLMAGELDEERQYVKAPISALRDLPMLLAFDLRWGRTAGRTRLPLTQLRSFEPLEALVQYGAVDEEGRQTVVALLRPTETPPGWERRRTWQVRGRLRLQRTIDAAHGRVATFESELSLDGKASPLDGSGTGEVRVEERWTFREELHASQPAFRRRVLRAIQGGVENLKGWLERMTFEPGSRLGPPLSDEEHRPTIEGELALILLALLKCDVDPQDPVIARALQELRSRDVRSTYSLSIAIMALEALHAPKGERKRLITGRQAEPSQRILPERDRAIVEMWTRRLIENHDTRVDPGYLLRWRYVANADYDNSNTQYALLGLYSAKLCGVTVPAFVWMSAARHWLDDAREVEGEGVRLTLTTHAEAMNEDGEPKEGRTIVRRRPVPPLAWSYDTRDEVNGSMTAAGISSATICRAGLGRRRGGEFGERCRELEETAERGFAWLARHFTVRDVPGRPHSLCSRPYYLFGIERACEFNRIARFQDRDWYFEGAVWLLEMQERNGSWRSWDDTAFALLFLKKTSLPVVTAPR